jgi:hypothetical protein
VNIIIDGPHKGQEVDTFAGVDEIELEYLEGDEYKTAHYVRDDEDSFKLAE